MIRTQSKLAFSFDAWLRMRNCIRSFQTGVPYQEILLFAKGISEAILLRWLMYEIKSRFDLVVDVIPPYRWVEGILSGKEISSETRHFILVESEMVEVDWLTYEVLMEGEALRIRCTRSYRAISIDRLSS